MTAVQSLLDRVGLNEKQQLDELCQWLLEHLHDRIGWGVLVQRSKMSNEELHRVFMLHHNMSPMQWISLQREHLVKSMSSNKVIGIDSRSHHG